MMRYRKPQKRALALNSKEKARFSRKRRDFPGKGEIFQEKARFSRKRRDFSGKGEIFQEKARFSRKRRDFPGKISRVTPVHF